MARIITIILLTFVVSISFAQQYTPMTAAGYQMKRLKVDSTLHIPSFCGVPTTRNSTAKEGAIALDTCADIFYMWNHNNGWTSIEGGMVIDTAAISAAIALRVKYTDTSGMLQPYLRKIDTTNKWVQSVTKLNDSTIRVVKNAITTDLIIRGNGVKYSDTAAMLSPYLKKVDTATLSNRINLKLNLSDTATMLSKYLRKTDTASLSNRINLKLNLSDTATMLSKYLRKTDTASLSNRINLKLNISDTSAMLSKYLRKTDTASLSARINTKLAIADTVNKWVQDVTKLNDSTIRVRKNNTNTDIILPKGTGGSSTFTSPNLQQVLDSGNIADKRILLVNPFDTSFANIEINPTNFNLSQEAPFINLHIGNAGFAPIESFLKLGLGDDVSNSKPYINALNNDAGGNESFFKINSDTLSLRNTTNYNVTNIVMSGTSGNYHMPTSNSPQINDTLATLQDVRANGSSTFTSPNLQQVLDSGNSAIDKPIILQNGFAPPDFYTKIQASGTGGGDNKAFENNIGTPADGYYANISLGIDYTFGTKPYIQGLTYNNNYPFRLTGDLLTFGNTIYSDNYLKLSNENSVKLSLPETNIERTLALSVNGNLADSTGNITITGSGSVTSVATGYGLSGGPITTSGTLIADTSISGLSGKYVRIIDTANRWVNNISRTLGKDSIIFNIGSTRYAIKDSVGTNPAPVGYYGAFQDTTIQVAAAINTPYAMKLGVTDLSNAVTIVSDGSNLTRITIANTGVYNIQFSAQFDRTNSGTDVVDIWLRKNGVNVAGSGGKLVLTGGVVASAIIATWNYVLDVTAGDYYQLMWSTPDTHVRLLYETAQTSPFVHPLIPSLILTVTQQSGIMAGTGITAINSLTGAAQTMVVGTDSSDFKIASTGTSHTFNLPTASATKRGALSSADWSTFNGKIGAADTSVFLRKTDSSTYYTKYRSDTSRTNIYGAISNKLNISDTSVFQRKSISAYTFMGNNTASAANATPLVYKDAGEQAYTGTITWTFTGSAPSGTTTLYYRWSQIGKTVNYNFYFYYATASVLATAVTFDLPTDMPIPQSPTGNIGTGSFLYKSNNTTQQTQISIAPNGNGGLRKSATGYEWALTLTNPTIRFVEVTGTYFVN